MWSRKWHCNIRQGKVCGERAWHRILCSLRAPTIPYSNSTISKQKILIMWAVPRKGIAIGYRGLTKETKVMVAKGTNHSVTGGAPWILFADSVSTVWTQA